MGKTWLAAMAAWCAVQGALAAPPGALLARGKYLMEGVVACGNCHAVRDEQGAVIAARGLAGGRLFDEPAFQAYAANITPDRATGIGAWSDAQLGRAIREGIRPDGSLIGPPMPVTYYSKLSDQDLAAIVAWLRAQPPVANQVARSVYHMPLPPAWGPPVGRVKAPPASDTLRYGQYLANIGHCLECHTPRQPDGMLDMAHPGAGGQVFKGPWGESTSRNLTPHETGLKGWSDAQIAQALRTGTDRKGAHYKPPMAFDWYRNISDADVRALTAYLRSLAPQPFGGKAAP